MVRAKAPSVIFQSRLQQNAKLVFSGQEPWSIERGSGRVASGIWPKQAVRVDVAVERLARNSQLGAQLADLGAGLAHRGLRQV